MGRSIFAGMTDYSHQSFGDMISDLKSWIKNLEEVNGILQNTIEKLKQSKYWEKVDVDFQNLIFYTIKFYDTSIDEITEIIVEISEEVKSHHVARMRRLYKTAEELDIEYGMVWNQRYTRKEYGNRDFNDVEELYRQGRGMAVDMRDLSNLASRLEDFVGKKAKKKETGVFYKKWWFARIIAPIFVTVFGGLILLFFKNDFSLPRINNTRIHGDLVGRDKITYQPVITVSTEQEELNKQNKIKATKIQINRIIEDAYFWLDERIKQNMAEIEKIKNNFASRNISYSGAHITMHINRVNEFIKSVNSYIKEMDRKIEDILLDIREDKFETVLWLNDEYKKYTDLLNRFASKKDDIKWQNEGVCLRYIDKLTYDNILKSRLYAE